MYFLPAFCLDIRVFQQMKHQCHQCACVRLVSCYIHINDSLEKITFWKTKKKIEKKNDKISISELWKFNYIRFFGRKMSVMSAIIDNHCHSFYDSVADKYFTVKEHRIAF